MANRDQQGGRTRQAGQSRGQRSLSHLGRGRRPRTTANRGTPSPAAPA